MPLAVLRVLLGQQADVYGVDTRLRQWLWCGILGELYGSAIETRFARDIDQVPVCARQDSDAVIPKTVEDAFFNESRLLSLRTRNSAAYKGIYALLMAQGTKDWIYNQPFDKADYLELKIDIHHIFPSAWCDRNSIAWEEKESIVNKTPLAKTTNIKLSGNAPSVYRRTIQKETKASDDLVDSIIRSHQIDTEALWSDQFDEFFQQRRQALCVLVENVLGKRVTRDMSGLEEGNQI